MPVFDHFAVSAATLAEGVAHVEAQTGHVMGPGGVHELMGTHNRLSGLAPGEYMEVIAIDPAAPAPGRARWFDLDRRSGPPRLSNWIARTDDLEGRIAAFPRAGRILSFARGPFRWRMAVPDDGILPFEGCFPALIQWDSARPRFPDDGLRLTRLELRHPEAPALAEALAGLIDDPRISVAPGALRLTATLDTPEGARTLI
ncbi:VOC family protein [Jannaschia ovalis]|uniref:VOC family protein n=1 Tax=Jannaschia ovalis TaxID=3038773 RepID=A0ABY8LCJ0_9RHOB|nr:VOC family protein [Jannaschia sp. GRR-S6-38]WGH79046.1 VOC family protein [Jannaschia sp. GRR-S6-38]